MPSSPTEMPDASYVTVSQTPFYLLTNQPAGETKKYLVEVLKSLIEKAGPNATATALAVDAALIAYDAEFGFTRPDIRRDIDFQIATISPNAKLPETSYKFKDCRVWPIPT
jgi:hypothetical protein